MGIGASSQLSYVSVPGFSLRPYSMERWMDIVYIHIMPCVLTFSTSFSDQVGHRQTSTMPRTVNKVPVPKTQALRCVAPQHSQHMMEKGERIYELLWPGQAGGCIYREEIVKNTII